MSRRSSLVFYIFTMLSSCLGQTEISITKQWNGESITSAFEGYSPITLTLSPGIGDDGNETLHVDINVPFNFTGSKPPGGVPGEPYPGLWNYEVVELFLANDNDQYVELEWAPNGEHIVLLLNGIRNSILMGLPLKYSSTLQESGWRGHSEIPTDYLPVGVTKMNAYAIFEKKLNNEDPSSSQKVYCSYSPSTNEIQENPDFHLLQYFVPVPDNTLPEGYTNRLTNSAIWKEALGE